MRLASHASQDIVADEVHRNRERSRYPVDTHPLLMTLSIIDGRYKTRARAKRVRGLFPLPRGEILWRIHIAWYSIRTTIRIPQENPISGGKHSANCKPKRIILFCIIYYFVLFYFVLFILYMYYFCWRSFHTLLAISDHIVRYTIAIALIDVKRQRACKKSFGRVYHLKSFMRVKITRLHLQ